MAQCLIYCRVSTEEQADKGFSLDTQEELCRQFASRSGYSVAGVYRDEGRSGTTLDRPALQELLAGCTQGKGIGAVIVQETDRLARNTHDHLTIRAVLQKAGVKLISVAQPMLDDSPEGKMIDTILASVNQFQSDINGRKTRKALQEKFNQGWWPGWAPLGYLNVAEEGAGEGQRSRKIITNDPQSWGLLREGFKLYLTGSYAADQIRDFLHEQGLRSKTGKKIPHSIMVHILKNPFYAGLMVWKGQRRMGRHTPMITLQEHQRVLEIMDSHNRHVIRGRRHRFLLRGFVVCGLCGQRYTAEAHPKKRKSYYHCATMRGHSNVNQNVETAELEEQVAVRFKAIQFSPEFIALIIEKLKNVHASRKRENQVSKQAILNQQKAIEAQRDRAEEKLLSGVLTDEAFRRVRSKLNEQLAQIQSRLTELENEIADETEVVRQVLLLSRDVYAAYQNAPDALKRQYLGLFWERFTVQDKKIVEAVPTELIRALRAEEKVINRPNWLPSPTLLITLANKPYLAGLAAQVAAVRHSNEEAVGNLY